MNDFIERDKVIEILCIPCRTCLAKDVEDCEHCSVPELCKLINEIPAAQVPEWTIRYEECPHCGAKMVRVSDE